MKKVYKIDGNNFSNLEEFYEEISKVLIPDIIWGKNLDAFNDILCGGFGTPDEGFILEWLNSSISKEKLGYVETVRQLKLRREKTFFTRKSQLNDKIKNAKSNSGSTVFDWLVEIIIRNSKFGVELYLK